MNWLKFLWVVIALISYVNSLEWPKELWKSDSEGITLTQCKHGTFLLSFADTHVSAHLREFGTWEENCLSLLLQIINPGDIVVDGGANIGAFTVPFAKLVGDTGIVYAFEPVHQNFYRLASNVALNELQNVKLFQLALDNEPNKLIPFPLLNFTYDANYGAISLQESLANPEFDTTIQQSALYENIRTTSLDSMPLENPKNINSNGCPKLIKLDLEYMEYQALMGARDLIARCKPLIYLENNCVRFSRMLVDFFWETEYQCFWDVLQTPELRTAPTFLSINMLCIPLSKLLREDGGDGKCDIENESCFSMRNFVKIEASRPFLSQYKGPWGDESQLGDEEQCESGTFIIPK
jgi:FkbM family methyltransferase